MFTGIIGAVGHIVAATPLQEGVHLEVAAPPVIRQGLGLGDSVACNGVCLTVVGLANQTFAVDVSAHTLKLTSGLEAGARLNLELALRWSDRLGGHLVTGHVDGVGIVRLHEPRAESWLLRIEAPADLPRYIAERGSIAVDGISLTVNAVQERCFEVNIIPHTRTMTILADRLVGARVNLEVDLVARYIARGQEWDRQIL